MSVIIALIIVYVSHRSTTLSFSVVLFSRLIRMNVVVAGGLIMNGANVSEIVLTRAEFAPWKRVLIEHSDTSGTSRKISA